MGDVRDVAADEENDVSALGSAPRENQAPGRCNRQFSATLSATGLTQPPPLRGLYFPFLALEHFIAVGYLHAGVAQHN